MKFTCSKELLDRQLPQVSRVITQRGSVPVLSNILIETDENLVRFSGTDLELAVTTWIPAEVAQEGTFTVPAKVFQEFVHQNPDEKIEFSLESFELVCRSGKVEARISGIDAEEFPTLPKLEKGIVIRLPLQETIEAFKRVVIACATDQSRPVLTAVQIQFSGEVATLVATDSFRLAEKQLSIVPIQENITLLLPVRTVQEVIRVSGSFSEQTILEMEIFEQQVVFRIDTVELYSRLITGAFPKYQAIIPTTFQAVIDVTTSELIQALRLSTIFSQAGVANVMIEVGSDGTMALASHGSQRGSTKHTIYAIPQEGFQPVRAAFNTRFLLDACSASSSTHLQLRFSGPTTALVVATEDPTYLQLVMPIRVDS